MRIPRSWLFEFVAPEISTADLESLLTMGIAEVDSVEIVGGEEVLELSLKPDRGDCLSVVGVAREVAALSQRRFLEPAQTGIVGLSVTQTLDGNAGIAGGGVPVRIDAPDLCSRYVACVIEGVKVGPSPEWLQRRILQVGLRPVNNVVDATNFVMMELGQPLHAFDMDLLQGPEIVVRKARLGEVLIAINGDSLKLSHGQLVIADSSRPIAVAGVMGGLETEVTGQTARLLIESAHFDPVSVRMTSRALQLKSDASYRFERSVDPTECANAMRRVVSLILTTAGGQAVSSMADVFPRVEKDRKVSVRVSRTNKILGISLGVDDIENVFSSLGLSFQRAGDSIEVTIPSRRSDLSIEEDLVEEVARVIGYDSIPAKIPVATQTPGGVTLLRRVSDLACDAMLGSGYTEIRSHSLTSVEALTKCGETRSACAVRNPISADRTVLRCSLLPSVMAAVATNVGLGFRDQHLFEIGHVFEVIEGKMDTTEKIHIAGVAMGSAWRSAWNMADSTSQTDFFAVKGALENVASALRLEFEYKATSDHSAMHPGRTAAIFLKGIDGPVEIGCVGELHPQVIADLELPSRSIGFEMDMAPLAPAFQAALNKKIDLEIYRQPPAIRDISMVVSDKIPADYLLQIIRDSSNLVTDATLFDLYRGEEMGPGVQSVAISIVLRSPDRTLTDEEANTTIGAIVQRLADQVGARRR